MTAHEIESWLCSQEWSPVTRKNHLLTVRTLFSFAVARSYLIGNPALAVDMPILENNPPEIHSPAQVRHVLETARADLNLCRYLAIRYFAGLRGSEAASLDESQIHPARGFIDVTAAKSKTRRRRLVTIAPALAAWLALGGVLPLGDVNYEALEVDAANWLPLAAQCHASFVRELSLGGVSECGQDSVGGGTHGADSFQPLPRTGDEGGCGGVLEHRARDEKARRVIPRRACVTWPRQCQSVRQ